MNHYKGLCPDCLGRLWLEDGLGDWFRCQTCNPPPERQNEPSKHRPRLSVVYGGRRDSNVVVLHPPTEPPDLPPAA